MLYQYILKPLLFLMSPEKAHYWVADSLRFLMKIPGVKSLVRSWYQVEDPRLSRTVFGIQFPNPVGLAAGFDKNASMVDELANLGFGFIEVGTVTPKPQDGNPKPRLFRLPADHALINRMGFNNEGLEAMKARLQRRTSKVIIGGNLGKNKLTPNELAEEDYCLGFEALFDVVDYFVVNVSSPNTPNLRDLQEKEPLKKLLSRLQDLNAAKSIPKPILLKIAPDLTNEQLDDVLEIVQETHLAGIIATNTTLSREGLSSIESLKQEAGGLSGKPLTQRSTEVIAYLHQHSDGKIPIIGVGGIHSAEDALDKLKAGASLVQVYTGFIYEGPGLIKEINQRIIHSGL
ncbi:quinone-dependent dihydroorotate dehydrogenase [Aquirufa rosea]|uniref:Dihydroorotate dehydrogenase (quinone) n=1 Tax=Aquirufa rosea TaxID=2509241 RepID=A0A4V1M577_9BACT|nr:quinone-dependent dihydroorotate dehydrogenase [Aquirufa rosea]RXK47092.1 quinone-dependent dihydroorotate dehydrogenase [Aquirufa rosea]